MNLILPDCKFVSIEQNAKLKYGGRRIRIRKSARIILYELLSFWLAGVLTAVGQEKEQTRALWVTRWDYSSPQDVEQIIADAAAYRFNLILFQVRGNGTVAYRSRIEPWSEEFGGCDPGWDPLQLAIEKAHASNIELHAWINVYPAWRGETPPTDSAQLYLTHPDWFMVDVEGRRQALNPQYVWLSPTNPQVREYLLSVCAELYTHYKIDGLHLDYIRYPGVGYSYDPVSLQVFRLKYGASPFEKASEWASWRRNAIGDFLANLYQSAKQYDSKMVISASVLADYWNGYHVYMQDCHDWLARGIMDAIYPMIYTEDDSLFHNQLNQHVLNRHDRHVYPGLYASKAEKLKSQIEIAGELGCGGIALFSYSLLFADYRPGVRLADELLNVWTEKVAPASLPWKAYLGDNQGPVVTDVKTVPAKLNPGKEFKIAAQIVDPSGVYDDDTGKDGLGIYLLYDRIWPRQHDMEVKMSRIKGTINWYLTDQSITAQPVGLDFRCRIYARDDYHESTAHPKRNIGYSDIWSLSILAADQTYVSKGAFGPLLWNATSLQVDALGQIWVGSARQSRVIVLSPDGRETAFSPIESGLDGSGKSIAISQVSGITCVPPNVVCIACPGDTSMLFRFDANTGEALPGLPLDFIPSEMDCDANGHLFILEKESTRWHVMTMGGVELAGSPFGIGHTGNDIAVLDNAGMVFISDRTTNGVQCWHGAIEGSRARYWRTDDLRAVDIGIGKVSTDKADYIYVSHAQRGIITIFSKAGKVVEHLSNGQPPLNSPREIGVTTSSDSLYVLESVGMGAAKLSLWIRQSVQASVGPPGLKK